MRGEETADLIWIKFCRMVGISCNHRRKAQLLWPPCVADADIIFCSCGYFLLSFFFFLAILSGRRLDVYHTSTHGVALVRI